MDLVFAWLAGLLTLINPCVLPVLPIVLAAALQSGRAGPLAVAAGLSVAFVAAGLGVTAFGAALGFDDETLPRIGAVLMLGFGLVLLVPQLSGRFATATAGLAARADAAIGRTAPAGAGTPFVGGLLLGAVWTPCIGPTLGGAIALASQRQNLGQAAAVMAAFALGVSTVVLALGYGARAAIRVRRDALLPLAAVSQPILGVAFAATGLVILLGLDHALEGWVLTRLPPWLADFSVRY